MTYSIMNARQQYQTITITRFSTSTSLRLQPYQLYNCCVAAVNEAGRGNSSCQTIMTYEKRMFYVARPDSCNNNACIYIYDSPIAITTAPTSAPTNIEAHQLNSTSVLISWRSPLAQYRNGIIRGYYIYVEFTPVNISETSFQYTTQDQHLLIDNLKPNVMYACGVAAYTVGRGPFSEPLTIVLNSENGMYLIYLIKHTIVCLYNTHHNKYT